MLIFANSTGNRFGAVCLGSKISPTLVAGREPLRTECGTIYVEYMDSELSPGSALYREFELLYDISFDYFIMFLKIFLASKKCCPIFFKLKEIMVSMTGSISTTRQ